MPDEGNVRYGVSNAVVCVDGKYVPVGEIGELEFVGSASDKSEPFGNALSALHMEPETYCINLVVPWWSDPHIRFIRLIGWDSCVFLKYKSPYTVRSLRRGGKSHRGKHA